ncbi:MAG: hypothetical protein MUO34_14980 [Ignavibacteriaceae bacterium]|nr:hypothetical protein [Ignavibacteriaceae bacterium]
MSKTIKIDTDEFFNELENQRHNPRILVLITNSLLEMLVDILILKRLKNKKLILSNKQIYSYSLKLVLLNEKEVIPDKLFIQFEVFRNLRNKAAHQVSFIIKEIDLKNLPKMLRIPEKFFESCKYIINYSVSKYYDDFEGFFVKPS